jgi:hypothetical protein
MSVFSMAGSNPALPTYPLQRSVRLRSSASAYFNRTPASTTNRQTYTWSGWIKLGVLSANNALYQGFISTNERTTLGFQADVLYFIDTKAGVSTVIGTSAVLRDPSSWYHILLAVDTTQATAANRTKIYINGVQQTVTGSYVAQNTNTYINQNIIQYIGNDAGAAGRFFDGYLEEINFIDGQALTPSSFGAYNSYGVWSPAKYTGSYGTNGFYLNFQDNSAVTTTANIGIGADSSGNGNYWTSNNISLTAGATYDSMLDVPTNTSPTNANYTVLSPLITGNVITPVNANLQASLPASSNAYFNSVGTIAVTTGKWYWECTVNSKDSAAGQWMQFGIVSSTTTYTNNAVGFSGNMVAGYAYYNDGFKAGNGTTSAYGASYANTDVIGVAFDADNGTITFYKNGVSQGQAFSGISNAVPWLPIIQMYRSTGTNQRVDINFGQQPFAYTVPTGFNRLNTYNLPDSIVPVGAQYMAATLYTGNASTQTITNTVNGTSMQPDFVWTKSRTQAYNNQLYDSVRGATNWLQSNSTTANQTNATTLTSFNSNGFTVGANDNGNFTNGGTAVGWQWRASNASAVTNTNGALTSQVSVNQSAGFSIVTWTGTGTGGTTVGHGLSTLPQFVIIKKRSTTGDWYVASYASGQGLNYAYHLFLNTTGALSGSNDPYYLATQASLTSNVLSLAAGNPNNGGNESGTTYVAYCWTPVPGYSAFGSYTGNGSANGPFVYLGFRPRFIMIKRSDSAGNNWRIWDTSRATYNVGISTLFPNTSDAEDTVTDSYDLLSNGFKIRTTGVGTNASGGTYIYAAFAENPFKNALAR